MAKAGSGAEGRSKAQGDSKQKRTAAGAGRSKTSRAPAISRSKPPRASVVGSKRALDAASATATRRGAMALNAQGPAVEKLQDELVDLGYLTAAQKATGPGTFGPQTERALKRFQQDNRLPSSGRLDADTEQAFLELNRGVKRGSRGRVVEGLQDRLVMLGFMTARQKATGSGTFGQLTEQALKAFQRQHGIEPSGLLTDETYKALRVGTQATAPNTAPNSTAVDTLLPASGVGFTTYNREPGGVDQFGRASTIQALIALGHSWAEEHPNISFSIGDISRKGGGAFRRMRVAAMVATPI